MIFDFDLFREVVTWIFISLGACDGFYSDCFIANFIAEKLRINLIIFFRELVIA